MTRTSAKTAKDFIEMKKQETPAQPKVVPDAVADVFPRPIGSDAPSNANERGTTLLPRSLGTDAPRNRKRTGAKRRFSRR